MISLQSMGTFANTLPEHVDVLIPNGGFLTTLHMTDGNKSKSLAAKVCHVESLRDFQQHIRKSATVEKFATSGGVFNAP